MVSVVDVTSCYSSVAGVSASYVYNDQILVCTIHYLISIGTIVQERMNEITARGGAQIAAVDPAGADWESATHAHMTMHRWHSSKGLLTPEVPQPTSPLAEAPPPAAQLQAGQA